MKDELKKAVDEAKAYPLDIMSDCRIENITRGMFVKASDKYEHAIAQLEAEIAELKAERECPKEGCGHWDGLWCKARVKYNLFCFRDPKFGNQFKPKEDK